MVIVESDNNIPTRPPLQQEIPPGAIKKKLERETKELGLDEIIRRCPEGYVGELARILVEVKKQYNANVRELAMVAFALVENRNAYIEGDINMKDLMSPDEAIAAVREASK